MNTDISLGLPIEIRVEIAHRSPGKKDEGEEQLNRLDLRLWIYVATLD